MLNIGGILKVVENLKCWLQPQRYRFLFLALARAKVSGYSHLLNTYLFFPNFIYFLQGLWRGVVELKHYHSFAWVNCFRAVRYCANTC